MGDGRGCSGYGVGGPPHRRTSLAVVSIVSARPALVIENDPGDPPGRIADWLPPNGVELDVVRPHSGEALPAGLTAYDALVVLGGPMTAYDDGPIDGRESWLPKVRALLNEAVGTGVPTLAICLGAQLLATAQGGTVEPGEAGPEIGPALVAKRDRATYDPIMAALPLTPDVIQWHHDVITERPLGAELLAASVRYENQAFRVGAAAWGMQFHAEATLAMVRHWAENDATELGVDPDDVVAQVEERYLDMEESWRPVFERFATVVRRRRGAPG